MDGIETTTRREGGRMERAITHDPAADIAAVLLSDRGMRLLRRLVGVSGALGPSYARGDATATAYNEGRRSIGLMLLQEAATAAPDQFPFLLMQEGRERHQKNVEK